LCYRHGADVVIQIYSRIRKRNSVECGNEVSFGKAAASDVEEPASAQGSVAAGGVPVQEDTVRQNATRSVAVQKKPASP
jgi:hypothetical protein